MTLDQLSLNQAVFREGTFSRVHWGDPSNDHQLLEYSRMNNIISMCIGVAYHRHCICVVHFLPASHY